MMVMTLCLMIYNLAQYFLRQALVEQNETLPDQLKKPTQKPTMERIGKMFRNVNVVYLHFETYSQELVSNLNDLLRRIIRYFGPVAEKIYGLSGWNDRVYKEGDEGLFAGQGAGYAWLWESGMEVTSKHIKESAKMLSAHHRTA